MPSKLNNDDRAWITGEIARQSSGLEGRLKEVENAIRLEEPWLKKQGYWFWPVLTIVLTSGLIGSVIHWSSWFFGDFVDHRIEAKLSPIEQKLNKQAEGIAAMNAKLDTISGLVNMLLENRLKAVAQLPPKEFQAALPGLEDTLTAMRKSNTSPSPATIEAIREKLVGANRNQPSYWGAAAAIVSYRSPDLQHDIPDCRTPLRATIDRKTGGITPELPLFQFRNCKIDLNDPQWQELYDTILGVDNLYFIKCFVIYHGPIHASIPINDAKKMVFIDCAFELASQGTPALFVQHLISALISSRDMKSVTVLPRKS